MSCECTVCRWCFTLADTPAHDGSHKGIFCIACNHCCQKAETAYVSSDDIHASLVQRFYACREDDKEHAEEVRLCAEAFELPPTSLHRQTSLELLQFEVSTMKFEKWRDDRKIRLRIKDRKKNGQREVSIFSALALEEVKRHV